MIWFIPKFLYKLSILVSHLQFTSGILDQKTYAHKLNSNKVVHTNLAYLKELLIRTEVKNFVDT